MEMLRRTFNDTHQLWEMNWLRCDILLKSYLYFHNVFILGIATLTLHCSVSV